MGARALGLPLPAAWPGPSRNIANASAALARQRWLYGATLGWNQKPWFLAYSFQKSVEGSAAAPVAAPMKALSVIGVSMIRSTKRSVRRR